MACGASSGLLAAWQTHPTFRLSKLRKLCKLQWAALPTNADLRERAHEPEFLETSQLLADKLLNTYQKYFQTTSDVGRAGEDSDDSDDDATSIDAGQLARSLRTRILRELAATGNAAADAGSSTAANGGEAADPAVTAEMPAERERCSS